MSAAPNPVDPPLPPGGRGPQEVPGISAAADRARAELHEEIERVRRGVEEMLAEQGARGEPVDAELRRELDTIQEDIRRYVKTRVRKSERKSQRAIRRVDDRTDRLEERVDRLEAERQAAEYRIHTNTENLLDGLLQEVRSIADRLEGRGGTH